MTHLVFIDVRSDFLELVSLLIVPKWAPRSAGVGFEGLPHVTHPSTAQNHCSRQPVYTLTLQTHATTLQIKSYKQLALKSLPQSMNKLGLKVGGPTNVLVVKTT